MEESGAQKVSWLAGATLEEKIQLLGSQISNWVRQMRELNLQRSRLVICAWGYALTGFNCLVIQATSKALGAWTDLEKSKPGTIKNRVYK